MMLLHLDTMPAAFAAAILNPRSLTARSFYVPSGLKRSGDIANREEFRVVEIPAGNGIGNARAVAKAYGCVATGGSQLGLTHTTLDALRRTGHEPAEGRRDKVLHVDMEYSLGYSKPTADVGVRLLGQRLRDAGCRRVAGNRRPRHRGWVRVRHEPDGLPPLGRSARARSASGVVPRCAGRPASDLKPSLSGPRTGPTAGSR